MKKYVTIFILMATLFCRIQGSRLCAVESTVCVCKNGKKYHTPTCRTIQNSEVMRMTKTEAQNKGYTPCKICKP